MLATARNCKLGTRDFNKCLRFKPIHDWPAHENESMKMADAAEQLLEEPVDESIYFQTYQPRWYEGLSTGTELDFLILIVLLPFIIVSQLVPKYHADSDRNEFYRGMIFCARTSTRIAFFSVESKWFRERLIGPVATYPLSDVETIRFDYSHRTQVHFEFTGNNALEFYFAGVWSDLESFKQNTLRDLSLGE